MPLRRGGRNTTFLQEATIPYNGAGVFTRLYSFVQDRINGIKINSSRMDGELDGIATALSNCITKDGQTTLTANIPFNGRKITGLGDATADTDALNRQTADARYLRSHGGCRLTRPSTTTLRLIPWNGNRIIVNGVECTIPDAGVDFTMTTLAAGSFRYVYAQASSGVVTNLVVSTTAPATTDVNGIRATAAGSTLVGIVYATTANQFNLVRSWFNDPGYMSSSVFSAGRSTTSTTETELNTEIQVPVLLWEDETMAVSVNAWVLSATIGTTITTNISVDGTSSNTVSLVTAPVANYQVNVGGTVYRSAPSIGYHYVTLKGSVSANSATWGQGTTLRVFVPSRA
jgi:hypothetical protein